MRPAFTFEPTQRWLTSATLRRGAAHLDRVGMQDD